MELELFLKRTNLKVKNLEFVKSIIELRSGKNLIASVYISDDMLILKDAMFIETVGANKEKFNAIFVALIPYHVFSDDEFFLMKREEVVTITSPNEKILEIYERNLATHQSNKILLDDFVEYLVGLKGKKEKSEDDSLLSTEKVVDILKLRKFKPDIEH